MEENSQKKVDETWKEKAKTPEPQAQSQKENTEFPKADFNFFLSSLAMQAWIGLGAIPNPATQKTEESLGQAKFIIDILDILKEKTKGNLNKEEAQLLEHILYELHMSFVNKTTAKP